MRFSRGTIGVALLVFGCGDGASTKDEGNGGSKSTGATSTGATSTGATSSGATSTGATSSGGTGADPSGGAGDNSAGTAGGYVPLMPPAKVADCDSLNEPGVFEEITPAEVVLNIDMKIADGQTKGGTFAMAVDPVNQGTVYVGTSFQGVWKSKDCGSSWDLVATGDNSSDVNRGMNWTLAVDPEEPDVVYTNSGYGSNGLFKSTDGGENWTDIWSKKSQPELAKAFMYNFANVIAIDPADHRHILLTFHEQCLAPHPATCIAESSNGGETWSIIDGEPDWNGNEGQVIFFMDDSKTWLWGSQTNGFFRTPDGGKSWQVIPKMNTSHLQGSQLLRTQAGAYYMAGAEGIWTSPDGLPATWTLIDDTGPIVGGLVSDGENMFASTCHFKNFCNPRYLTSPEADGKTWTALEHPVMTQGGTMGFDKAHKLLYSSNGRAGLWRVVVP